MVIFWGCDILEIVGNFSDILLIEFGKEIIVFLVKVKLRKYFLNLFLIIGSVGLLFIDDWSCLICIYLVYLFCGKYVNG